MTVPFPLDAFDDARPVRRLRRRPQVDTDKLAGIGITIAVHAVILALALTAPLAEMSSADLQRQAAEDFAVLVPRLESLLAAGRVGCICVRAQL